MKISRNIVEKYIEGASEYFIGARRGSQGEQRGHWRLPEYGLACAVVAQGISDIFDTSSLQSMERNKIEIVPGLSLWCEILGLPSDFAEKTVQKIMRYKLKEN